MHLIIRLPHHIIVPITTIGRPIHNARMDTVTRPPSTATRKESTTPRHNTPPGHGPALWPQFVAITNNMANLNTTLEIIGVLVNSFVGVVLNTVYYMVV